LNVRISSASLRLRRPFVASWGSVVERELLVLELSDLDGMIGYGEAAPLPGYDGVSVDEVRVALEACRGLLERDGTLAECAEMTVLPQALAAVDLALWDLRGRRARQPVWRLLGAESAPAVEVNYTIGATDRAGAAAEAAAARGAGFRCVKVKVGVGDDAGRIAAVRAAAGPEMAIRLDANGVWSVEEAEATLRVLAPAGIELCEEPVSGASEVRRLQAPVPVALDESALDALDERVADAVCLKVARCGGITGLVTAARRARAAGYEVYLASTLDGPLGIAAALHAAAVIRPDRPCGLATLGLFDNPSAPFPVRDGVITAPSGLGLGILPWAG
jgi:o-succinylbenzoate synthase